MKIVLIKQIYLLSLNYATVNNFTWCNKRCIDRIYFYDQQCHRIYDKQCVEIFNPSHVLSRCSSSTDIYPYYNPNNALFSTCCILLTARPCCASLYRNWMCKLRMLDYDSTQECFSKDTKQYQPHKWELYRNTVRTVSMQIKYS